MTVPLGSSALNPGIRGDAQRGADPSVARISGRSDLAPAPCRLIPPGLILRLPLPPTKVLVPILDCL